MATPVQFVIIVHAVFKEFEIIAVSNVAHTYWCRPFSFKLCVYGICSYSSCSALKNFAT